MSEPQEKCAAILQALNDWAVTYAPDMCDNDTVQEAKSRVLEHGTLAYIADASEKMREVIAALSEAEQSSEMNENYWRIEESIKSYWGDRCEDFDADCPCCKAWQVFDKMRANRK